MTQYLYDGLNPVEELDGANPPNVTATMLTGLNIDEFFQRSSSNGAFSYLTDMLGSTVALADSGGALDTTYTYDPFGNVTVNGADTNPYQFTGRENDGTGLYYYRARYYSPTLQRFVSQDPIGFAGGSADLYRYASNDPVRLADPSGLENARCKKLRKQIEDLLDEQRSCTSPAVHRQIQNQLLLLLTQYKDLGCNDEGPDGDGGGQPLPQEGQPDDGLEEAAQAATAGTELYLFWQWFEEWGWWAAF